MGIDAAQVIEVIDHQTIGLFHAFDRGVTGEIETLQPGALSRWKRASTSHWRVAREEFQEPAMARFIERFGSVVAAP